MGKFHGVNVGTDRMRKHCYVDTYLGGCLWSLAEDAGRDLHRGQVVVMSVLPMFGWSAFSSLAEEEFTNQWSHLCSLLK